LFLLPLDCLLFFSREWRLREQSPPTNGVLQSSSPPANGIHGSSGEWHPSAPPLLSSAGILVISRCLYSICCRLSRSSSPHFSSKTEDPKKPRDLGFHRFREKSTVFGAGSWLHFKLVHAFGSSSSLVRGFSL
ncbi:hypothetical protein G4B88_027126, partial [Cannabis sativa]